MLPERCGKHVACDPLIAKLRMILKCTPLETQRVFVDKIIDADRVERLSHHTPLRLVGNVRKLIVLFR